MEDEQREQVSRYITIGVTDDCIHSTSIISEIKTNNS